jgi:hypothetical protein
MPTRRPEDLAFQVLRLTEGEENISGQNQGVSGRLILLGRYGSQARVKSVRERTR